MIAGAGRGEGAARKGRIRRVKLGRGCAVPIYEGPGMKSGLGTIYYYFPDFAYETKNLRQRMSAL